MDEVRRRVQQDIHGHRGRRGDPLYGIRTILRLGVEHLSEKQKARITAAVAADERHDEVHIAWQAVAELRSAYTSKDLAAGKKIAQQVIDSFPSCPIREIARLGRTLKKWREPFLAYFTTDRANNGGTEAVIIWSPQRRVIDVAHGADWVRQRHVIRSMSPTEDL